MTCAAGVVLESRLLGASKGARPLTFYYYQGMIVRDFDLQEKSFMSSVPSNESENGVSDEKGVPPILFILCC